MSRDIDVAVAEPEAVPGRPSTRQRTERMRRSLTRTGAYLVLVALEDQPAAPASTDRVQQPGGEQHVQ